MGKFWNFLKSKACLFYIILINIFTFFYSYIACDPVFYTPGKEFARNIAMLLFSLEYIIVAYFLTKPSFTFESFKKDDGNQMEKTRKSTSELTDEFKFWNIFKNVALFMVSTALPALFFAYYIVIYSFNFNISIDFILGLFIVIFTILQIALFSIGKVEQLFWSPFFSQIIFFCCIISNKSSLSNISNILLLFLIYIMIMLLFTSILKIESNIIILNNSLSIREENIKKRMKEFAKTLGKILGEENKISQCLESYDSKSEGDNFEKILNYLDATTNCLNRENFKEKRKIILKAKNQLDSIDYIERESVYLYDFHIRTAAGFVSAITVINFIKDIEIINLIVPLFVIGIISGILLSLHLADKYFKERDIIFDIKNKKDLIKLSLDNILIDIDVDVK